MTKEATPKPIVKIIQFISKFIYGRSEPTTIVANTPRKDKPWPSANGYDVPWSEVHWTDHGTPQFHTNPHEHIFEYNPDKGGWIRKGPSDF